jgi:hypothetical protein
VSAAGVQMDCIATEDGEDFLGMLFGIAEVSITDFGCRDENSLRRFAILKIRKSNMGIKFHERNKKRCSKYTGTMLTIK